MVGQARVELAPLGCHPSILPLYDRPIGASAGFRPQANRVKTDCAILLTLQRQLVATGGVSPPFPSEYGRCSGLNYIAMLAVFGCQRSTSAP